MKPEDIKNAIKAKTAEFEVAMSLGKPHVELRKIYKELKELQFQLVQAELNLRETV